MSKSKFVRYGDRGFWAYDVALGVFLKHLIDVAEPLIGSQDNDWLKEAISEWRIAAVIDPCGLKINQSWSSAQLDVFVNLVGQACNSLAERKVIGFVEIHRWPILDNYSLDTRGASEVETGPVVELGQAIIGLIDGSLSDPPTGSMWFFGWPEGRTTIEMRKERVIDYDVSAEQAPAADSPMASLFRKLRARIAKALTSGQ